MKIIFVSIFLVFIGVLYPNEGYTQFVNDSAKEVKLYTRIDSLIRLMTLEEKVNMIKASSSFTSGGVSRLGIPEITMSDGPHGVRHEHNRDWSKNTKVNDKCTYLPTGITLAATWNPELGYQFGAVLGREANYRGKDIILGPGVNIIRSPLNGRNFEYLSEDPYLNSVMAAGYIRGVQDQGVAACVKHYLANNQETKRQEVNVLMNERALREIYLPAFRASVQKANVYTVMGAYNKFRGQYCAHHEYLVNTILKRELGFKGALISDWSAVQNTMEALKYGTDIEMGTDMRNWGKWNYNNFFMGDTAIKLVKAGIIKESLIDEKVRRILWVMHKTNMFGKRPPGEMNTKRHQQMALKIAEEAIVLLKNERVLPLQRAIKSIAVIGDNAIHKHAQGGGSSQVPALYEITPLQGIKNYLQTDSNKVKFIQGYIPSREWKADPTLIAQAVKVASESESAIVFAGYNHGFSDEDWGQIAFDGEGIDKKDIKLPFGQDELIKAVVKANPNTIIVLTGGAPSDMRAWVHQAKAVLQVWYPGMEGGNAIANVLFGKVNPSGKLPVTFPEKLEDSPAHKLGDFPGDTVVHYKEGIFVGYRYFDTYKVTPLFPFGHGLSYTNFDYSKLNISKQGEEVSVSLLLKNTGSRPGAEVVQVYISDEMASLERPEKELKSFQKIYLQPGEVRNITIALTKEDFMYFNDQKMNWILEPGKFFIKVGSSSRDIRQTGVIEF